MKQKQWIIPLLILFIGIIMPLKIHATELKETDGSVVKWDTAKIERDEDSTDKYMKYTFEKESYKSYDEAVDGIAHYAVDLVGDRKEKEDSFSAYIPFSITTDKELETHTLDTDAQNKVKDWVMYGDKISQHEVISFSYSRGNYDALNTFYMWPDSFKKTDTGYEGIMRVKVRYTYPQDFFDKYEAGVKVAISEMNVAGKSDYDKVYAVCDWVHSNVKYAFSSHDQSGVYAMVEKNAVCAGYARLACYLGRCVGIDIFFVNGSIDDDHAWNVVKLDGEWYYIDPTNDNLKKDIATSFLVGKDFVHFVYSEVNHVPGEGPTKEEVSPYSYEVLHSGCEHEWKERRKISARCTKEGIIEYQCQKCESLKYEYLSDPTGHDYVKDKVIQEADCTHPEVTQYICSRHKSGKCDGRYSYKKTEQTAPALGHAYTSSVTKEPTCTENGVRTYTCSRCGDSCTETISKTGHKHTEIRGDKEATCTVDGYTGDTYCTDCGTKIKTGKTIPKTGHTWTKGDVVKEATCSEEGKRIYICSTCHEEKEEPIAKKAHTWEVFRVTKKADGADNIVSYIKKCKVCGEEQEDTMTTITDLSMYWQVGTASYYSSKMDKEQKEGISIRYLSYFNPTDAEDKSLSVTSSDPDIAQIDETAKTITLKKTGGVVITVTAKYNPTVTKSYDITVTHDWETTDEGKKCKVCGAVEEHKWNDGMITKEPTCTKEGEKTYVCMDKDCYATKVEKVAPLGHNWKYHKLTSTSSNCKCSRCGEEQEHDLEVLSVYAPTCTTIGKLLVRCKTCKTRITRKDPDHPALGHDWKDNEDGTAVCSREGCGQTHSHTWDQGEITKEPTCAGEGEKIYHCTYDNCKAIKTESIAKTEHTWDEGKITKEAACEEEGVMTYTCTVCREKKTEKIPATGHLHTEIRNKKEATCKEDGYTGDVYCKDCGEKLSNGKTIAKTTEHTWDAGKVTKVATCTEKGLKLYTCTVCDKVRTEEIPATGHQHTEVRNVKEATCTKAGYTGDTYCKDCGEKISSGEVIAKLAHTWDEGNITKEADCKETGVKTYTCHKCGATKTEDIPRTEHTWDEGEVTTVPTCTKPGVRTYTCSVCKATRTEAIKATGHLHTEIRNKKDASCTENGYTGDTYCKDCGALLKKGETIDVLGHQWKETKRAEPSYTEDGQITYTCSRCGEQKAETLEKLAYPKAGTKYTVAGCQYKVTKAGVEVSLIKANKKAKRVTIPAVIKVNGVTYKVTSIGAKAFNGSKKLTKVTVGTNIKRISNNAFYKCKSLKMVIIKSVLLTKKTASKKAFKGVGKKMVIKVPKKMKKVYAKMFKGLKVK